MHTDSDGMHSAGLYSKPGKCIPRVGLWRGFPAHRSHVLIDVHKLDVGIAERGVVAETVPDLVLVVPLLVQQVLQMSGPNGMNHAECVDARSHMRAGFIRQGEEPPQRRSQHE